jgi:hypothetical protein
MTFKVMNYTAGGIQLSMSVFLIVWLILLVQKNDSLSFAVGEYNGEQDGIAHGRISLSAIVSLLVIFTLVTGLVHILAYARSSEAYQNAVDSGNNWMRWVEYSITATIMLFVIAVVSGTNSTDTLILLITSTICCMLCGFLSEATARSDTRVSKLSTFIGWLLMLSSFAVILRRFGSIFIQLQDSGSPGPPPFVWAIIIGMMILYMSFGVIHFIHMYRQWNSTETVPPEFHQRIEKLYTLASMISKILLVVLLSSGLFARPQ